MFTYIHIYIYIYIERERYTERERQRYTYVRRSSVTVPQKGYAKRGSKKMLLLSDLKVTQK